MALWVHVIRYMLCRQHSIFGGRDSVVATDLSVRDSNHGGEDIFRTRPDRLWGQPSLLYNGYRVSIRVVKRPGRSLARSIITHLKYTLLCVELGKYKWRKVSLNSFISLLDASVWFIDCLTVPYLLWTTACAFISINVSHFPTCDSILHIRHDSYLHSKQGHTQDGEWGLCRATASIPNQN